MADHFSDVTKKADFISREAAKEKKVYSRERRENVIPVAEIDWLPAADVVEVVRCKECKLMCHDEHGYWCINDYQACLDPEKDYCSRAERRNDDG